MAAGGWNTTQMGPHNWEMLVTNVQMHLRALNWASKSKLKKNKIDYVNAKATLLDSHTVQFKSNDGVQSFQAENIVIATGCRPNFGNIKGAEDCCISSDDIFSRKKPFGNTLVVGGSYVALECAGLLKGLGVPVTLISNSKIMTGFDKDMAAVIRDHLSRYGITMMENTAPLEFIKVGKQIKAVYLEGDTKGEKVFDDVLLAIGRKANTSNIGLENTKIKIAKDGKIITNSEERTNIPNIYAIGDIAYNRVMLTPVASKAGKLLANRLYGNSKILMDYNYIPTAMFTPVEYGTCGMTEEQAIAAHGNDVVVYHSKFTPLEWHIAPDEERPHCYTKIICEKSTDRVIGFHIVSPHASEITQGFAVAMKCGITKATMDSTIGIHPTIAEECIGVNTKKDGKTSAVKGSC